MICEVVLVESSVFCILVTCTVFVLDIVALLLTEEDGCVNVDVGCDVLIVRVDLVLDGESLLSSKSSSDDGDDANNELDLNDV